MPMTKAEEKRAAIVAAQEARELAEREARQASGGGGGEGRRAGPGKPRTNWAASPAFAGNRRGRPPKPRE
jgi:hypothetical protein